MSSLAARRRRRLTSFGPLALALAWAASVYGPAVGRGPVSEDLLILRLMHEAGSWREQVAFLFEQFTGLRESFVAQEQLNQ